MNQTSVFDVLTLQGGFQTALVMVAVAIYGAMAAIVGCFCIWRRKALISDAMSHATLPGVCTAFLIMHAMGMEEKSFSLQLMGAATSAILGGLTVQWITRKSRLYADTATGIVLSVFFGLGVVLLSIVQTLGNAEQGGLNSFIYGHVATLHLSDAVWLGVISVAVLATIGWFFTPLMMVSFDEGFANVRGINVRLMDFVILACVVISSVFGLVAIGLLLVLAVMIIPPVTARLWSHDYQRVMIMAALFGGGACYLGAALSAIMPNYPTGATIVLVSGLFFAASLIISPIGGIIPQLIRRGRLDFQIKQDHVLRTLFEAREKNTTLPLKRLLTGIGGYTPFNLWLIHRLRRNGYIAEHSRRFTLSNLGVQNITTLIQGHRLWERYLLTHTAIDRSHVHQSADLVEHVLTPERVRALAEEVGDDSILDESAHEIEVSPS